MFFTYILHSNKHGGYYIGSTNNLEKRLNDHNQGIVKSTKSGIPWVVKHSEKYNTRPEAQKRELQLKSWKKRKALERLISRNRGSSTAQVGP